MSVDLMVAKRADDSVDHLVAATVALKVAQLDETMVACWAAL